MYDLIVIGAGPAGVAATERAARLGAKVCLVDAKRAGGTDAVSGVVPARTLAQIAHLKRNAEQLGRYGIEAGAPTLDFGRALARCREVVEELHAGKEALARQLGEGRNLTVLENAGEARFVNPNTILLADSRVLTAKRFVISVGGHARRPDFIGAEHALVPSDLWQEGAALPGSAVILGTGHTGVQVASILADFGCKVHLLERGPRILSHEDEDLAMEIQAAFEARGVEIVTAVDKPHCLAKQGDSLTFGFRRQGRAESIDCDAVVVSQGWSPNTATLGLEAAGVTLNERGFIEVDDCLRTAQPHIYAAGDVTGRMMLVTAAMQEGYIAAGNAVSGTRDRVRHRLVSTGGYPFPEHGAVGLTEARAREAHDCQVVTVPYSENPRAIIDGKTTGFCKLIVERRSRTILGCHVVGERAVEVVQLAATAMAAGLKVEQIAALDLAYPTYVQIIGEAAYRACLAMAVEIHDIELVGTPLAKAG